MGKLDGKVVIVTGGGRGMGAATSRLFVEEGAKVVIADVLDDEGETLAGELGQNAVFRRLDVTDEANWADVVAEATRRFGGLHGLVNNAGIIVFNDIVSLTKAEFEKVIGVNLVGTFLGIKTAAPKIIESGGGSIVNISSVDGLHGSNSLGAYGASKWGVRGLTKVAALELGHQGVRVNSVHPGGVNTAMGNSGGMDEADVNKFYRRVSAQRVGRPEEVARVSAFLMSDDASYVYGAEIAVDGGMTAGIYHEGLPGIPQS